MLFIGSDHGGYYLKSKVLDYLAFRGFDAEDCGCFSEESVDYPDFARAVTEKVINTEKSLGILICGTGIGISMAANKVDGIRAALCTNEVMAKYSKQHNDANILCLGARIIGLETAKSIVDAFLDAKFEGGRHARRVGKIECCQKI